MKTVRLTYAELTVAAIVGALRQVSALRNGRKDAHGFDGNGFEININGASAEMALAKHLGVYWEPVARAPHEITSDIGDNTQVRSTPRPNGCLIVHPTDPDDQIFILVVTAPPEYRVIGSIEGRMAKQQKYWRAAGVREPAFFVPQEDLAPL